MNTTLNNTKEKTTEIISIVEKINEKIDVTHLRFFLPNYNLMDEFKKDVQKITRNENYVFGSLESEKGFLDITITCSFEEISWAFRSVFFSLKFNFYENADGDTKVEFSIKKELDNEEMAYSNHVKDLISTNQESKIMSFNDYLGESSKNAWDKINLFLKEMNFKPDNTYSIINFPDIFENILKFYQKFWHECYGEFTKHVKEEFRFKINEK